MDFGECFQQMLSVHSANDPRVFADSPNECNSDARRMLRIRLAFTFHMQISFRRMRSANAWRPLTSICILVFSEYMANSPRM